MELWVWVYIKDASGNPISGATLKVNFRTTQGNIYPLSFTSGYDGSTEVYTINPNLASVDSWEASATGYNTNSGEGTPPQSITLAMAPPTYSLTITVGAGGTTDPSPATYTLTEGTQQQVTAIPVQDYSFLNWQLDGANRTENPISILMNNNHTLNAVFTNIPQPPPGNGVNKAAPVIITVGAIAVGAYLLYRSI